MINIHVDYSIPRLLLANINKKNTKIPKRHGFFYANNTLFTKRYFKRCGKKTKNHI